MVCLDNVPVINMLTAGYCTTVLLLWKKIHFLKCCIFGESHQIVVTRFLIFGSSLHCAGKCTAKLYATHIAGAYQSLRKNRSELSTHFQFSHSNSFILSHQVLCWPLWEEKKTDKTSF